MNSGKLIRTCSIWRALEVVGDTSVLLILEAAWLGARRFDDIRARTGLLQTLQSDRLKRLVASGILFKAMYRENSPRFEYRMTQKGLDLYWPALMMLRWERRWGSKASKLSLRLHHNTCGKSFEPTPACLTCGEEITARDVDWSEGPGVGWMDARYSRRRQQRHAASHSSGLMVDVAKITGDRWACLVLRSILTGLRRFDEIRRDTAIATNILSERLSWLTAEGVIRVHDLGGRTSEYRLTEKGIDYYPILLMLLKWGDKYYVSPEGPPLLLRHKVHGHALDPAVVCSCCGEPIQARDVTFELNVNHALKQAS
jgi:DNA-binding HxlR family transcriptional regulator